MDQSRRTTESRVEDRSEVGANGPNPVPPHMRGGMTRGASVASATFSAGCGGLCFPESDCGGIAAPSLPRTTSVQLPQQSNASASRPSVGDLSPSLPRGFEPVQAPSTATSRATLPSPSMQSASACVLGSASHRQIAITVAVRRTFTKPLRDSDEFHLMRLAHYSPLRLSCPAGGGDGGPGCHTHA